MKKDIRFGRWDVAGLSEEALGRVAGRGRQKHASRRARRRQAAAAVVLAAVAIGAGAAFWNATSFGRQLAAARSMLEDEIARNREDAALAVYELRGESTREVRHERKIHD